jgi:23S rRNA pseudouridine1911/1915/1917 synthase
LSTFGPVQYKDDPFSLGLSWNDASTKTNGLLYCLLILEKEIICENERLEMGQSSGARPMKKPSRNARHRKGKLDQLSTREDRRPRFSRECSVLYEDEAVVVLDKPPGLLAVPIKGSDTPSALSVLAAGLKATRERALVVHRIDRFASGILLFAKTDQDRNALVRQFLAHTPVRQYLAVVRGRLKAEAGTLVHYFRREGMFQQLRTARDPQAVRAELRYFVESVFADTSLVRVDLVTGLQNQIRVQFSAIGHPVIGDRKYHRMEASEPLIARVALHATYLQFVHPRSGERVSIDCGLPRDFKHLVQELSRSSRSRG